MATTKKTTTQTAAAPDTAATQPAAPAPASPAAPAIQPATQAPLITAGATSSTPHSTKVNVEASYQALIAGLLALYQSTDLFVLKTGTFTRDEVVTQLQAFIAAAEQTKVSNQAWRSDVQNERQVLLTVTPIRSAIRAIAQARFGRQGAQLLQLGFAPVKVVKKSVSTKVQAVAKSAATRAARGTKGSKQKAAIHGDVTTTIVTTPAGSPQPAGATPVVAPAAPAPAAAPAAPAGAAVTAPAAAPASPAVAPAPAGHPAGSGS